MWELIEDDNLDQELEYLKNVMSFNVYTFLEDSKWIDSNRSRGKNGNTFNLQYDVPLYKGYNR